MLIFTRTIQPRLRTLFILIALSLASLFLPGCEFLHRNTIGLFTDGSALVEDSAAVESVENFESSSDAPPQTARVGVEKLDRTKPASPGGQIEIVWEIPDKPVEGFLIHYGFAKDSLDQVVRLRAEDLERYEDPRYGFVYRHRMKDIPADQAVFVAMATFEGEHVSARSEVFEVVPTPAE